MVSGLILHEKWVGCPLGRSFVSRDECETAERSCVMQMRETSGTLPMKGGNDDMSIKKLVTIVVYTLIGWALCFATMGIGQALLPLQTALIIHAIAAPIFFMFLSVSYFKRFDYTTPLQTALLDVSIVIALDF